MKLYQPFPSKSKNKKYSVYVFINGKPKLIHFGDKNYQQFRDKLGFYRHLDHNDQDRRTNYLDRHGRKADINTAKYWSHLILWNFKPLPPSQV